MMSSLSAEEPDAAPQPRVSLADTDAPVAPSNRVIYQVFHGATQVGRRRDYMKRTIRFRYGVLVAGEKTEEHEIVLDWSVRPGDRLVTFDGERVYGIRMKGFGVFDHTFATPDGRRTRLIACSDPPIGASDDFKAYEIIIDGVSYYDFPTRAGDGSLVPATDRGGVDRARPKTVGEVLCPEAYDVEDRFRLEEAPKEIERQGSSPRSAAQVVT